MEALPGPRFSQPVVLLWGNHGIRKSQYEKQVVAQLRFVGKVRNLKLQKRQKESIYIVLSLPYMVK